MANNTTVVAAQEQGDWRAYLRVMLYAALIGIVMALLAFAFLALLKVGTQFLTQSVPHLLWPGTTFNLTTLLIAVVGGLLVGAAIYYTGEHTGLGAAQKEYAEHGRIEYRYLPSIMLQSFLSLWSGASLGPEGPLTDLCGRGGSWIAEKLKVSADEMRTLVYAAIAGAFGAFFLSPLIGAFIAFEYMSLREIRYERFLLPGIVAACTGYAVYVALPHESLTGLFAFPNFQEPRLIDLLFAVGIGILGGLVSVGQKLLALGVVSAAKPLHERPIVRALVGGLVVGVVGVFLPLTLYSGQSQTEEIVHTYAQIGVISLLALALAKAFLMSLSFATGFKGGPIFPTLFIGGALGAALNLIAPGIPAGVCILGLMGGVLGGVAELPITATLLLGVTSQPSLIPVIAIAAIAGTVIGKAATLAIAARRAQRQNISASGAKAAGDA
jgi:chloride channel protein, CIC family